jgi:cation diffusion facilitator CzcD-associated flavoprotein CzcO
MLAGYGGYHQFFSKRSITDNFGRRLPEPDPAPPPTIPRTPLYPGLHTNAAVPQMTYPNIPYPAGTHLFASHEPVQAYLVSYAHRYNLLPYIRFNHEVLNASWLGTPEAGLWKVTFSDDRNETHCDTFEHLIVATGNNRFPREPSWPGQDEWLAKTAGGNGTQRKIIHSAWYRHPEKYVNKSILIVGDSPSGRAVAIETASLVSKARTSSSLC